MVRSILVVDDEASMRSMLSILFGDEGYQVKAVKSAEEAMEALRSASYDVVLSDIRMPGLSGIELLSWLRDEEVEAELILMTAYASTESAIEALKLGAFDYVTKPFQVDELLHIVRQALEKRSLKEENILLRADLSQTEKFGEIIGGNPKMRRIYALIERIAPATSTVLIEGESGTGKELIARAIHKKSPRQERPFVTVNCGGLPESLLESELFGYAKGAFTGAVSTKKGLFDMASGGTIFLDEVGEMSPGMQVKLLRTLQEKRIRPVGSNEDHAVDIRVITATNRDLLQMVKERNFREDLYYRINVINIKLPPLRERREDVVLLASHFLSRFADSMGKDGLTISNEVLKLLEAYRWPGNIRELENVLERAVAIASDNAIERSHLPEQILEFRTPESDDDIYIPEVGFDLGETLEGMRLSYINKALEIEDGVVAKAAGRLGMSFRSMRYYMKKYRLDAERS